MAIRISAFLAFFAIIINAVFGKEIWKLMENNNIPGATYKDVGSWSNWISGYHTNDKHDGFLDIGSVSFDASNLNLSYSVETNCTDTYPLFANGRVFCLSNNMLFSYYPQNGTISFWYLIIGTQTMKPPTFATSGDYTSLFLYSYSSSQLYLSSFDAMTGELKGSTNTRTYSSYYYSPYPTGTSYGQVYFTNRNQSTSYNGSVYAYNIDSNTITLSDFSIGTTEQVVSLCDNKVVTSGYYAYSVAFNAAPNFQQQWFFGGEGFTRSSYEGLPPVCLWNGQGYRLILKPYTSGNYNCYVLNAINGEQVSQFQCGGLPLIHYNKASGLPDVAIVPTGQTNQVLAVEISGDNIFNKELWYGEASSSTGYSNNGFIVGDYYVTGVRRDSYTFVLKVYNVYNGNTVYEDVMENLPYSSTNYPVIGGLYDDNGEEKFMIIVRVGKEMRAYTELMDIE